MSFRWAVIGLFVGTLSCAAPALDGWGASQVAPPEKQEGQGLPPKESKPVPRKTPGPEHQKLQFFVGSWDGDIDLHQSEYRLKGKTTSTASYRSVCNGFAVVCDYVQQPAEREEGVPLVAQITLTFDTMAGKYRIWWLDSNAMIQDGHGVWEDNALRFDIGLTWGGRRIRQAITFTVVSDTEFTFKMESAFEDKPLQPVLDGTYKKKP